MTYRRRSSPLHAVRAVVGALWCLALGTVALTLHHPVVLVALLAAVLGAGFGARVPGPVWHALLWGVPFALVIVLVNALVVRQGLTVIARLGTLPGVGSVDVTLEAVAAGAVLGMTAVVLVCSFALHSSAVDPDDLLRAFRRVSFRSALTAALATRMVPLMARDARRLADAQRCRAGEPASWPTLVRAISAGAMDRALDVAATLEVRGYGSARRAPATRRPWSRHDLGFGLSAVALVALAAVIRIEDLATFATYPRLDAGLDAGVVVVAGAVAALVLLPFADRRGIGA